MIPIQMALVAGIRFIRLSWLCDLRLDEEVSARSNKQA